MKKGKVLKIITIILVITVICLVSFIGVYVKVQNRMENKVKDYQLAMDLKGSRVFSLKVKDGTETIIKDKDGNVIDSATDEEIEKNGYTKEEKTINKEEDLNKANYQKTKKIIEERLKRLNVEDYNLRFNEEDGTIYIEVPEDKETDHIVSNIAETSKFEIIDSTSKDVLMDNSSVKSANVLYNTTENGTIVYLNIEFNKEGKEKLKEISNTYVKQDTSAENTTEENATNETTDESSTDTTEDSSETTDTTSKEKQVTLQIDGTDMITTSFEEEIANGSIQLSMGSATTDKDTLNDTKESATTIATLLDIGKLPLEYDIDENKYIQTDITNDVLLKAIIGVTVVFAIALIILVLIYRLNGLLSVISYIGLVATYLLVIRYTNTLISISSLAGVLLILILNYLYNVKMLGNIKNNKDEGVSKVINKTYVNFVFEIIPIAIISIVFTLMNLIPLKGFGTTLFWGVVVLLVYNIVITKGLIKIKEGK